MNLKLRNLAIVGLAGILLAAGAYLLSRSTSGFVIPAECLQAQSLSDHVECLKPAMQTATNNGNIKTALSSLSDAFLAGKLDDCHALAHELGHVAFARTTNVTVALSAGNALCTNGYYHGVVEAGVRNIPGTVDVKLVFQQFCGSFPHNTPEYDSCVHGLGHGFLLQGSQSLSNALTSCAQLPGDAERDRCEGGVFMQNAMRSVYMEDKAYEQAAPKGCDGLNLSATQAQHCAGQIGEIAMFHYRHDLEKALALCDRATGAPFVAACRSGAAEEAASVKAQRANPSLSTTHRH